MAREIYEIKLIDRFYPANSHEDALNMVEVETAEVLADKGFTVKEIVPEEDTMKLFMAAKAMCDAGMFKSSEIEAAIRALAIQLGYCTNYSELTDCVLTWVDRFSDMSVSELQEWLIG